MGFTFQVDVPKKTENGIPYSHHINDYVLLLNGQERIFVQHGRAYRNGAEEVPLDEAPSWFWEQWSLTDPSTRRLVGLLLPEDHQRDAEASLSTLLRDFHTLAPELQEALRAQLIEKPLIRPVEAPKIPDETSDTSFIPEGLKIDPGAPTPKTWTCGDCGKEMELRIKGVHCAQRKRLGKCI